MALCAFLWAGAPVPAGAQGVVDPEDEEAGVVEAGGREGERVEAPDGTEAAEAEGAGDAGGGPTENEGDERARELYLEGDQLYAEGRYEEAIEAFLASYELSGRPLLLYNLANSYERLGAHAEAADALRRYRDTAPLEEQATLDLRIDALEARIETPDVTPSPPQGPVPPEDPGGVDPTVGWIFVASGGVLVTASVVLGALALVARDDAEAFCRGSGDARLCSEEAADPLARDRGLSIAADVSAGVGVGLLAAGVVMLLLGRGDADEGPPETTDGPSLALSSRGIGLGMRW